MKFVLLAVTFCLISVSQGKDTILTSLGYKQSYNRDESGAILDNTEYSKKFLIDCPVYISYTHMISKKLDNLFKINQK